MPTMNLKMYAQHQGVSAPTVVKWVKRGWLVLEGSMIDVERSDDRLRTFRDPNDARASRGKVPRAPVEDGEFIPRGHPVLNGVDAPATPDATGLHDGAPTEEARRVKEIYLARKNKLEFEQDSGNLVPLDVAKTVLFTGARAIRDAWLGWPAKYGALIAADLGVEADRVTDILTGYVHKQVADLGEPDGLFEAS